MNQQTASTDLPQPRALYHRHRIKTPLLIHMPGYHVHIFVTAAGYDSEGRIVPAGAGVHTAYAGSLLFQSDSSHRMANYDVYHSHRDVEHAILSQTYVYLGKVRELYWAEVVRFVLRRTPPGRMMLEKKLSSRVGAVRI